MLVEVERPQERYMQHDSGRVDPRSRSNFQCDQISLFRRSALSHVCTPSKSGFSWFYTASGPLKYLSFVVLGSFVVQGVKSFVVEWWLTSFRGAVLVPNTYGWDILAATVVRRSQTAHYSHLRPRVSVGLEAPKGNHEGQQSGEKSGADLREQRS